MDKKLYVAIFLILTAAKIVIGSTRWIPPTECTCTAVTDPKLGNISAECGEYDGYSPFCYVKNDASCTRKRESEFIDGAYYIGCQKEKTKYGILYDDMYKKVPIEYALQLILSYLDFSIDIISSMIFQCNWGPLPANFDTKFICMLQEGPILILTTPIPGTPFESALMIYNVYQNRGETLFPYYMNEVSAFNFSTNGKFMIVAGKGTESVKAWRRDDTNTGSACVQLSKDKSTWEPNEGTICWKWTPLVFSIIQNVDSDCRIKSCAISDNGQIIAFENFYRISLYNGTNGHFMHGIITNPLCALHWFLPPPVQKFTFLENDTQLAIINPLNLDIRFWDIPSANEIYQRKLIRYPLSFPLFPDQTFYWNVINEKTENSQVSWHLDRHQYLKSTYNSGFIWTDNKLPVCAVSNDGQSLAVLTPNKTIDVYKLKTPKLMFNPRPRSSNVVRIYLFSILLSGLIFFLYGYLYSYFWPRSLIKYVSNECQLIKYDWNDLYCNPSLRNVKRKSTLQYMCEFCRTLTLIWWEYDDNFYCNIMFVLFTWSNLGLYAWIFLLSSMALLLLHLISVQYRISDHEIAYII